MQIYGKNRFFDRLVTSTDEEIHALLLLNDQSTHVNQLCTENTPSPRCKNQLCLQVNVNETRCLSIDATLISTALAPSNNINAILPDPVQSQSTNGNDSSVAKQRRTFFYRPWSKILFCIIGLSIFLAVNEFRTSIFTSFFSLSLAKTIAFFVKRYQQRLNQRAMCNEQHPTEGCLTRDEPTLDEFNVIVDDRVSGDCAEYRRDILAGDASVLLFGRRRDSI